MSGFLCSMVGVSVAATGRTALTVTANGNAQVDTAQSKFGGAAAQFDGTTDYLSVTPLTNFAFGTGDFTIEFWFRSNGAISSNVLLLDARPANGNGAYPAIYLPASVPTYYVSSANRISGSTTLSTNTWYHLAISRSGTSTKMFLNGTQEGSTYTDTTTYLEPSLWIIGAQSFTLGAASWNGWFDEFRVSNSARYTTTFTPSTTPFVNDANTLLLIHANGTDASTVFTDDNGSRSSKGISALGNAQISTAQSKFSGSSALFDGTGDYLLVGLDTSMALGAGNWTIEMWVRLGTTGLGLIYDPRPYSTNGFYPTIYTDGGRLKFFTNSADRIQSNVLSTATWYHLAVVKNSGSTIMYIDGTQQGSTYTDSNTYVNSGAGENRPMIGAAGDSAGGAGFNGYLDELRVSNTARYSTTFTAPSAPFVNDANTLLLIHANGTDASTVFTDDNS